MSRLAPDSDAPSRIELRAQEEQDRLGYASQPQDLQEAAAWEREAVWPPRCDAD